MFIRQHDWLVWCICIHTYCNTCVQVALSKRTGASTTPQVCINLCVDICAQIQASLHTRCVPHLYLDIVYINLHMPFKPIWKLWIIKILWKWCVCSCLQIFYKKCFLVAWLEVPHRWYLWHNWKCLTYDISRTVSSTLYTLCFEHIFSFKLDNACMHGSHDLWAKWTLLLLLRAVVCMLKYCFRYIEIKCAISDDSTSILVTNRARQQRQNFVV